MKKNIKILIILGVMIFPNLVKALNENDYNDVNSTYTNAVQTYTVGSGCSSDTSGVTCYSGDSYYKILTENSSARKNNPMLVFHKGDIIEFVADTAKSSSTEGMSYGLNKGFIIVDGSYNDITSQYAQVLTSVV